MSNLSGFSSPVVDNVVELVVVVVVPSFSAFGVDFVVPFMNAVGFGIPVPFGGGGGGAVAVALGACSCDVKLFRLSDRTSSFLLLVVTTTGFSLGSFAAVGHGFCSLVVAASLDSSAVRAGLLSFLSLFDFGANIVSLPLAFDLDEVRSFVLDLAQALCKS